MLIRASAPEMIVADEIGGIGDAAAIAEAARCGTAVAATAHAGSFRDAENRTGIGELLRDGAFDRVYLLGGQPGRISERYIRRNGAYEHVEGDSADNDYAGVRGCGEAVFQCAEKAERGADADSGRNAGAADSGAQFRRAGQDTDAKIGSADVL